MIFYNFSFSHHMIEAFSKKRNIMFRIRIYIIYQKYIQKLYFCKRFSFGKYKREIEGREPHRVIVIDYRSQGRMWGDSQKECTICSCVAGLIPDKGYLQLIIGNVRRWIPSKETCGTRDGIQVSCMQTYTSTPQSSSWSLSLSPPMPFCWA